MKRQILLFVLFFPQFIFAQNIFNIVSYGALADGSTNNSKAIQKAIDACNQHGGGTVLVPAGEFLTGTIVLKSNTNLCLDAGAVLLGSPSTTDYPSIGMSTERRDNALVVGINAQHVTISGRGTIDGNGRRYIKKTGKVGEDFDRNFIRQKDKYMVTRDTFPDGPLTMLERPGVLILLINCNDVLLKDFNISDAPNWCLHLGGCAYVNIQSLNILNSLFIPNADGIDASNCRYLNINNCNIIAGDDGIAISPCADGYCSKPSENYTISNCNIVSRSAGIRLGWGSNDIRNIVFQNMNIQSNRGIGIFVRGMQTIENIQFSNMVIQTRFLDGPWWGNGDPIQVSVLPMSKDTAIGRIKNVRFSNMYLESENGIAVYGSSPGHITDLVFNEINLLMKNGPLTMTDGGNIDLRPAHMPALKIFKHDIAGLYAHNVDAITIRGMDLKWGDSMPDFFTNGLWFEKCRQVVIKDFEGKQAPNSKNGKAVAMED